MSDEQEWNQHERAFAAFTGAADMQFERDSAGMLPPELQAKATWDGKTPEAEGEGEVMRRRIGPDGQVEEDTESNEVLREMLEMVREMPQAIADALRNS